MNELCDLFNGISTKSPEEEYSNLERVWNELCNPLSIGDIEYKLKKIYDLFRRYKLAFIDDMDVNDYPNAEGIKHGANCFINYFDNMKMYPNINTYRIMYAIAKSVIRLIMDSIYDTDSCDESIDSWG